MSCPPEMLGWAVVGVRACIDVTLTVWRSVMAFVGRRMFAHALRQQLVS